MIVNAKLFSINRRMKPIKINPYLANWSSEREVGKVFEKDNAKKDPSETSQET